MKRSIGETIFTGFNTILLICIAATVVFPLMHIFAVSVSSSEAIMKNAVSLWPIGTHWRAYADVLAKPQFKQAFLNTIFLTVTYTLLALLVNTMAAFSFSRPFFGKKVIMYLFVFTMYFSGGLIPSYMLITQTLKLYNNFLAYLLPGLTSVFYIIVIRSQIEAMPPSLIDAAEVDGASLFQTLFRIVLPSIRSTIAAIAMFLALGMWNMWYSVLLYTDKQSMWTLQYLLRAIVFEMVIRSTEAEQISAVDIEQLIPPQNFQNAAILLVAAPIILIYPFIQKYFVKGILTGAVKE